MKKRIAVSPTCFRAFTLIELLVVIGIIAILAGLIVPALMKGKEKGKIMEARRQMAEIETAISQYRSLYGHYPLSSRALAIATPLQDDYSYGYAAAIATGNMPAYGDGELMAMLLDWEKYGDGTPTLNEGHAKNTQEKKLLASPKIADDISSPGVALDAVYRDPWGHPYIISIDANDDGRCRDVLYKLQRVSQIAAGKPEGFNGLRNSQTSPDSDFFECTSPVMVWSSGPNGRFDPLTSANEGVNQDNVLSWKQ